MALILNIETATDICSVALANENGIIDIRENIDGRSHSSLLTVLIEDLLKKNSILVVNLDAVAISIGPGSYTGLRIGLSVAKGLCFGAGKPLIAVSTLQSMAYSIAFDKINKDKYFGYWLCPMLDAKRMEVYTAFYDMNGDNKIETKAVILSVLSFEEILNERKVLFFGNGANKFSDLISNPNALFINGYKNSSRDMILLSQEFYNKGIFADVAYIEPFYLKEFLATIPKNKVLKN